MIYLVFNNFMNFYNRKCLHVGGNLEDSKENRHFLSGTEIDAGDIQNKIQLLPSRDRNTQADHFSCCNRYSDRGMHRCMVAYRTGL